MSDSARRWALLFALIGVTAVWGVTFVMVKDAVDSYPVYAFLAVRFAVASLAFAVMFPRSLKHLRDPALLAVGAFAGVFLTAGYVLQTVGLMHATASVTAFITGLFVVLTPLFEYLFYRRPPGWGAGIGLVLAVPGMWLLTGADLTAWGLGEWLVLGCAVAFAVHLVSLAGPGRRHDPMALTFVQLAFTAVACGVMSLFIEDAPVPTGASLWVALLVTGVLASAVAFGVQTYALRYLTATRTALVMIMEPVFGGLFGYLLAGEVLGPWGVAGAALMLSGMIASEAGRFTSKRPPRVIPDVEGTLVPVAEESA